MPKSMIQTEGRKYWIDGLRAIAMILVVFGHQAKGFIPFSVYTSAIKMPMFFVITGYVFNTSRTDIGKFLKNLFFKIIIPWMVLTMPIFFLCSFFKGTEYLFERVTGVLSGEHTWFMSCLVWTEIIWFFTNKIDIFVSNKKEKCAGKLRCIIPIIISVIGIELGRFDILSFQMINRAMIAQVFVLGGFLFREKEEKLAKTPWIIISLLALLYVGFAFVGSLVWPGQVIDVHLVQYFNYPFCFFLILIGCFTMFVAARKHEKCSRVMLFIGQNTLIIYLLHMQNVQAFLFVVNRLHIAMPESFILFAIIKTMASLILCCLEAIILNNWFPVLVGKTNRRSKEVKDAV